MRGEVRAGDEVMSDSSAVADTRWEPGPIAGATFAGRPVIADRLSELFEPRICPRGRAFLASAPCHSLSASAGRCDPTRPRSARCVLRLPQPRHVALTPGCSAP